LPTIVYLHGGGHVAGSVAVFDPLCRKIALATRHVVIAVEYRLAPEHPYPAGMRDAEAVVAGYPSLLMHMGLRYQPILTLAGDSAGGTMAATLAHHLQGMAGKALRGLVLLYPSLDYTLNQPSVEALASGYLLEKKGIEWCLDQYFRNHEDRTAASPLFMPVPGGFPPTLIISAEFCPLRDEALQYAQGLKKCSVEVRHVHFGDMIHTFLNMETLIPERCREVYQTMADFLSE